MIIDTHSHIHFKDFPDREVVLKRSIEAGVKAQILVGCTPGDSFDARQFIRKHPDCQLWCTLGVHPHNADEFTDEIEAQFEKLAEEKEIVAIGEIGLDYFRNFKPAQIQQKAFRKQLELAKKLDLSVVIHIRDAWDDAFAILKESGNNKVILHCFTGNLSQAEYSWENGWFVSFSGVLTYPKNEYLREIAKLAPQDKILLETDCPYLPPQIYRGKRNEPAYIIETAKILAEIRGVSLERIADITTKNAFKAFCIEANPSAPEAELRN